MTMNVVDVAIQVQNMVKYKMEGHGVMYDWLIYG